MIIPMNSYRLIEQEKNNIMDQYKLESKKGEGAFSEVFMAKSLKTGKHVAIKCLKKKFESIEKVKKIKEIQALKHLSNCDHVVRLLEVLYDEPTGKLALVFELMDQNLYEWLKDRKKDFSMRKIKLLMYQLLKSIEYIHKKSIFHRDIKPENVLISGDVVKLADLGSCKGIYHQTPHTEYISTRWYRAPECLMTDGYYDYKMDIWGYGCILYEIITKDPLFPGKNELNQVHKIHNILGTPPPQILERFKSHATHMQFNFPPRKGIGLQKLMPTASSDTIDFLYKLLAYDPNNRPTAQQALKHQFFQQILSDLDQKQMTSTLLTLKLSQNTSQVSSKQKHATTLPKKLQNQKKGKISIEQQHSLFPPIHANSTVKPSENVFKKAHHKAKNNQNYYVLGKKAI